MGILSTSDLSKKSEKFSKYGTLKDNPEGFYLPNLTNYKFEFRHMPYFSEKLEISNEEKKIISKTPCSKTNEIKFPIIPKSEKIKVIIDTDLGTDFDDVMAIVYALNIDNLEILGITTNYCIPDLRAEITRKIVNAYNQNKEQEFKKNINIISGASLPMGTHQDVFLAGHEGKPFYKEEEIKEHIKYKNIIYRNQSNASNFIVETVKKYPNEIKIISIGIPTNIGLAIKSNKEIIPLIKEIVIMGCGSLILDNYNCSDLSNICEELKKGNKINLYPNHNLIGDTLASKILFDSKIPTKIVSHIVTSQFWVKGPIIDYFRNCDEEYIKIAGALMNEWFSLRRQNGQCPHDPITVHESVYGYDNSPLVYFPGTLILHEWAAFSTFIPHKDGKHFLAVDINENKNKFFEILENTIIKNNK